MNEKDCFVGFIVGFGFGVGRVPLASQRTLLWLPPPLRLKMRGLLNFNPLGSAFITVEKV
jgi:hypothetical protein